MKLPPEVEGVRITPDHTAENGEMVFKPQTIPPGLTVKYTLTYKSLRTGRAEFISRLTSDRDRVPLEAAKHVTIGEAARE